MIGLRASLQLRQSIETWATQQDDTPLLSEAIRRLLELGLAGSQPQKPSPKGAAKASDLAAEEVAMLMSPLLPDEERHARKHRLIKGPREFRDIRRDRPKAKA